MIKMAVLKIIRFYQRTLSLDSGWFSWRHPYGHCRFYPHCSEYCYQAIAKYGVLKGSGLGLRRILKCNPFNKGGEDKI